MSNTLVEKYYTVKCPQCGHDTFAEITVAIVGTSPFKKLTYYPEMDCLDPEFKDQENTGGTIDRIECNKCHHPVARDYSVFRAWVLEHGTLLNP